MDFVYFLLIMFCIIPTGLISIFVVLESMGINL